MRSSDVHVFNKVAKSLSFTAAAREVGTSRSSVSKQISRLEQSLGVILLNRSTRSVSLTEAGRILFQNTSRVDEIIEQAVDDIRAAELEPTGTVKLSIPSSLGKMLLPSLITKFQVSWPDIRINIHSDDHSVAMIADGYDLAICVSEKLKDSSLISRRLGTTSTVLAASPRYLKRFGTPRSVHDLKGHRCLGFRSLINDNAGWSFAALRKNTESLDELPIVTDNLELLIDAACHDNGIICVPKAFISRELERDSLRTVLADSGKQARLGLFIIYPHRNTAAKVRVLVDFLEREMKSQGIFDG